jgi:tRNA C32,U32 (ribose-2'-O)-methylase TrmJ
LPSRAEIERFKKLNIAKCVSILNLCYLFKKIKSRAMKKKAPKEVTKKISKKDKRKSIETKLEDALSGMKNEFSEKKFRHLVKKAGKLFSTGISTAAKPKRQKPKKAAKKTSTEISAAQ